MIDIRHLAKLCQCPPAAVSRAIANKVTTKPKVKLLLAKEGIEVKLVQPGAKLRDWPACETANAYNVFSQNRAKK